MSVECAPTPMMPAATARSRGPQSHRLLAAWHTHGRADLGAHLMVHGPVPRLDPVDADRLLRALDADGLLGRGGGGFPTARKLDAARRNRVGTVVVNAMEGEPASAKDAVLLLRVPHLVLDGAQLAAAVTGARRIVIAVADDRDDLAGPLRHAVAERRRVDPAEAPTEIARPPGRYVAGEESALAGWLAHRRSVPAFRPDRGTPLILGRRAALVHNAETMAQVALAARRQSDDRADDRADDQAADRAADRADPLTTLVTVSGAVARPGVAEVLVGTPLVEVVAAAEPTGPVAAVLVGGFGGAWVGAADLATPFSAPALRAVGAAPGAGVLAVLPEGACGIAETAAIAAYLASESAGQCGPCVYGLPAVADDLARLATGRTDPELLARMAGRLSSVEGRGACRHPDGAARLVRSALTVFADDVARHAAGRPCSRRSRGVIARLP